MIKIIVFFVTFFASIPATVWSDTHTVGPSDCSANAVNAAIAAASDGDVVELTCSGSITWSSTVRIPNTKGITLRVQGGSNTPKASANFPLTVSSNQAIAVDVSCENNRQLSRVTGFKFTGSNSTATIQVSGRGKGSSNVGAYRIDNCRFDTISTPSGIYLNGSAGELTGVTDNCTFYDLYNDNYTIRIRETWKGASSTCFGYDAWVRPFTFGSANFHFIEDCLFSAVNQYNRHYVACDGSGGKYVIRHNTFNAQKSGSPDYIDAHGDGCNGLGTGTRGGEIYGNTFQGTSSTVGRVMNLRGGQFLIYDNTFTTAGYGASPICLTEYRASSTDCWQGQNPSLCNSGIPQCATPNDFAQWYPLPGQIRGTYVWNNLLGGSNQSPSVLSGNYVSTYIQQNRDYWVSASKPAALSGYSAYSYPHPLRTGSEDIQSPKNLRLTN